MSREIIGFADDTTGALDVAGSFQSRGRRTTVQLELGNQAIGEASCHIINLNSRYDTPEQSATKLRDGFERFGMGKGSVFLKVDSTLRGNIAADAAVLQDILPASPLLIAPAFPFYGRTCLDGNYLVKGQPIGDTEFAGDRAFRWASSQLHDNRSDVDHIDWRVLERGVDAVLDRVDSSGHRIFTFDTRDQTDLEVIADAGLEVNASMIGSSGLARAFPKERTSIQDFDVDSTIPTLYVVGSIHPTSRTQKEELAQHGVPGVELLRRNIGNTRALDQIKDQAEHILGNGQTVYIATPDEVTSDVTLWRDIEDSMGHVSGIHNVRHNLVIVGGETARATLRGRDIHALEVRSEYEAGIPVSTEKDRAEAILTKAGGFGHANTLVDIHNYLQ